MASDNPTKNYHAAVTYCLKNNIYFDTIANQSHEEFLKSLSGYDSLVFVPKVLETFSRLCAEAKMLNLKVLTNKKLIGFYSEDSSDLSGVDLIKEMKTKNQLALELFEGLL